MLVGLAMLTQAVNAAQPAPANLIETRQEEAMALMEQWNAEKLFSTPVQVHIKAINPTSEAAST